MNQQSEVMMLITKTIYHLIACAWSLAISTGLMSVLGVSPAFSSKFPKHRSARIFYILGNIFSFILLYLLPVMLGVLEYPLPYTYTFVLRITLLILWTIPCLNGSGWEKLYYVLIYYAFFMSFSGILSPLYHQFDRMTFQLYLMLDYSTTLLQYVFLFLFSKFLKRYKLRLIHTQIREWILYLYCPLSILLVFDLLSPRSWLSGMYNDAIIYVLMLLNIPIFFYLCYVNQDTHQKAAELNHALNESNAQVSRYRYTLLMEEKLREERHELKNKYFYLQMLLAEQKYGEMKAYLDKQTHITADEPHYIFTGNTLMDYLLSVKVRQAKELGINVVVDAIVPCNLSVNDDVLCTILLNLLDNAIEASEKEQSPDIHITLKCVQEYLVIKIANKSSMDVLKHNPHLLTTKKDAKKHGHGIKIISNMVEANDGLLRFEMDGSYFTIIVMLPLSQ